MARLLSDVSTSTSAQVRRIWSSRARASTPAPWHCGLRSEAAQSAYTCAAPKAARSAETCAGHRGVGCLALAAAFSCICGTLVDTGVGGAVFCLRQGARHKRHRSGGAPSHPRMTVTVGVSVRVCVCVCVCVSVSVCVCVCV